MPPNLKFPIGVPLEQALQDIEGGTIGNSFPPLTNENNNADADDFFLQDVPEKAATSDAKDKKQIDVAVTSEELRHDPAKEHRKIIKRLSSLVSDPRELDLDDERLARSTREAGQYSFGIVAVEVWVMEDETLHRPKGGWWRSDHLVNNSSAALLSRLEGDVVDPINPGVDIAGILWSESKHGHTISRNVSKMSLARDGGSSKPPSRSPSMELLDSVRHVEATLSHATHSLFHHSDRHHANKHSDHYTNLVWRDLMSIIQDPDSAKTQRINDMAEVGCDQAAGVPFYLDGHQAGIVIYYSRSTTKKEMLSSIANEAYLNRAANMIGSAYSMSEARRAVIASQEQEEEKLVDNKSRKHAQKEKVVSGVLEEGTNVCDESTTCVLESSRTLNKEDKTETIEPVRKHSHISTYCRKCRGGNLQVPPPMCFSQTMLTIFGAFCGLLVLSSMNEYFKLVSDEDYFLLIGPFGALMTLMYGLSSAPASQPRNAILGQAVAGAVSLCFTYIPDSIIPQWLRRAIGPAFGIGAMVKLGIPHPPAGAHAVLYASGYYNFGFYALVVLGTAVSVIPATLINNLSSKRQYPTYWKFLPILHFLRNAFWKKNGQQTHSVE